MKATIVLKLVVEYDQTAAGGVDDSAVFVLENGLSNYYKGLTSVEASVVLVREEGDSAYYGRKAELARQREAEELQGRQIEEEAERIYDEMRAGDPKGCLYPWTFSGHSEKQEEARQLARERLSRA